MSQRDLHPPKVRRISSATELKRALSIRLRVFVREQGVPREIELDEDDRKAIHFLASVQGKAVGTARLVIKRGQAKIGRMAVLKSWRGRGIGKLLLRSVVMEARVRKARIIFLHAQVPVVGFYERFGFRSRGPVFTDAGIFHRKMFLARREEKE